LLLFDFLEAADQHDERVACDRVHSIAHSAPFLAVAHLVCGIVLLLAHRDLGVAPDPWFVGAPLAAILLLDLRLWSLTARRARPKRPHLLTRLTALYALLGAILWLVVVAATVEAGVGSASGSAQAAMIAGMAATITAFMSVPALLIISCSGAVAAAALFTQGWSILAMSAAFSACLAALSLVRARDSILAANQRLIADWESGQAARFVAAFEQSGRGWFWETNADGALTYLSETLAAELGKTGRELAGRPFAELLLVEDTGPGGTDRPTLGFHLAARFPFSEVIVSPNGRDDVCWSLSGSPSFDDLGRFLGFRGIAENLSEERRAQVMSSKLARIDSLTGLPNRAAMRDMLDEALTNAERRKQGSALLLIDLDRFKAVNDTLGHPVGDVLLKQVAQRLSSIVGEVGQVGRLGGDEFEAVLPGEEEEGRIAALSERLIQQLSKPYLIRGHTVTIGASVGIALARPGKSYADALIRDADLALYAAKAAGRGTYRFFDAEMHSQATDRQILQKDLEGALAKGELRLLFQPIVEAASEDLAGFEALVRWAHPVRGQLAPAEFLSIAEESGLIEGIGEWILRSACEQAAKWPRYLRLAVNVSPVQLRSAGFAATVANALASTGIEPARLELEFREDALLADSLQASEAIAALKGLGVRLVLDDFGSGACSLASLRIAPLDCIKIDQGFLRSALSTRSRNHALLSALVTLAESLRMEVTAEGAETLEDLALARKLNCSHIQGFLFGRPMAAAEAGLLAAKAAAVPARESQRGRPPRHSLIRRGTLQSGGEAFAVRLRNISGGGAMVESDEPVPLGAEVQLALEDGLTIPAEVRWCEENRIGLKFTGAFDLRKIGRAKPAAPPPGLQMLTPSYLASETSPSSPWAGRKERLNLKDVQRR
ncbi:EAL domain-containing protein, partial [Allosphingosinicella sp.]|uniref:EAL domain-containing protein n=1 Tax=Allosphingosinicella sp. TaxID=2823234 RepID=UPI002F0BDE7A